jgi:hypothetical protein
VPERGALGLRAAGERLLLCGLRNRLLDDFLADLGGGLEDARLVAGGGLIAQPGQLRLGVG